MDMNYNHNFAPSGSCPPATPACGGSGSPNDRLLFVARFDANIDVFDTYFGFQVGTISIRDPIIGPLRVAKDASGNQLLFGITARGRSEERRVGRECRCWWRSPKPRSRRRQLVGG